MKHRLQLDALNRALTRTIEMPQTGWRVKGQRTKRRKKGKNNERKREKRKREGGWKEEYRKNERERGRKREREREYLRQRGLAAQKPSLKRARGIDGVLPGEGRVRWCNRGLSEPR